MSDDALGFERVLVVAAHPDDIDFGSAGTVARLTDAGSNVTYLIVTDGDAGGFDPLIPRDQIPGIRRAEQLEAASFVGVKEVDFLGYRDGRLVADLDLRRDISRVIRHARPDLVICPSPERDLTRLGASHPDHLATGEATICAIYPDARNPFAFPELLEEGFESHTVHTVWLMAARETNHFVDITDVIDRKVAALLAHASQHPDPRGTVERVRARTSATAAAGGLEGGRLAEAFFALEIP